MHSNNNTNNKVNMKTYEITIFTPMGVRTEIYKDTETVESFEQRMKAKYGLFHQLNIIEI